MAVTQDSFTGNGTKTDYDFTFPYLKQSEVKASLDGTATTNFRFLTATRIQFVNNTTDNTPTAPASGVKIKIFRETDASSLAATFYAGSAIKSEDLNDNFTQNLYATQEVTERYLSNLGGTMTGDLNLGEDVVIKFEGATDNDYETTLTVTDPTADRTITLPNETGTVITSAGTDVIDSAHYVAGSIDLEHMSANSVDSDQYVDGSIDLIHMSANSVDSDQYVDGSIDHVHLSNNCIDGDNIQDDVINSEHIAAGAVDLEHMSANSVDSDQYVDGSIDSVHIGNDQIDSQHYAAGSIDLEHMSANSVDSDQYVDGSIDLVHMSANSVDSDQYVDGSIDHVHLSNDCIDGDNIADDVVNSEHIAAGAVDLEHMSANSVDSDQYVDGSIDRVHLSADIIDATKIEDDAVTTDHIADAELVTLAGMQSGTASRLADTTALTATTAELNILDNKSFRASGDGALTTTSDTEIPSSKVVANHVAAQLGTVGGFTTIATEVAFPATASQPAAGVIISISDAAGIVVSGSSPYTSTTGRTVDGTPATVTINNFPSSLAGETLASGVGLLVTSTGSGNTYTYHKLLAAETDVKQLSDDINDFNARYRVASSAPGSNNDAGDMYFDTSANKMKVYNGTTSTWDDVASVGNFYINTISSSSNTGGGSATFNGSAYRFTLSNAPTSAQQLIVSVNGVIQKPNAGSSQPSEGFAISGNDIIFAAAPASGSDYFIVTQGSSVSIGTPSDNTVSTAKIQNLAVTSSKLAKPIDLADSEKVRFGTGNDLEIYHDGTNSNNYIVTSGDHLFIKNNSSSHSVYIMTNDETSFKANANGATELYYDGSKKLETKAGGVGISGHTYQGDDEKAYYGASDDLQISHNGLNSTIKNSTGWLVLGDGGSGTVIKGAANENAISCTANGAVEIYHDNTKKIETTSGGAQIVNGTGNTQLNIRGGSSDGTATIQFIADDNDANNDNFRLQNGASNDFYLQNYASGSWETNIKATGDGAVELYHDNNKKFETTSTGINVTGAINVNGTALSAAPEITGIAEGTIAANKPCIIKSNGKIDQVEETVTTQTPAVESHSSAGTAGQDAMGESPNPGVSFAHDEDNDTYMIVWNENTSTSNVKYRFGYRTTAGNIDITWRSVGDTGYDGYVPAVCYDRNAERWVVSYQSKTNQTQYIKTYKYTDSNKNDITSSGSDQSLHSPWTSGSLFYHNGLQKTLAIGHNSTNNKATINFVHINGDTVDVGSGTGNDRDMFCIGDPSGSTASYNLSNFEIFEDPNRSNKIYITTIGAAFSGSDQNKFELHTLTVTGTPSTSNNSASLSRTSRDTLLAGSSSSSSRMTGYYDITWDESESKALIFYQLGDYYKRAILVTTTDSGGSASSSSLLDGSNNNIGQMHCQYDKTAQQTVIFWKDGGVNNRLHGAALSISGSSISKGTTTSAISAGSMSTLMHGKTTVYVPSLKMVAISAYDGAVGNQKVWHLKTGVATTNLTADNFVGFSSAGYSDGDTAKIHVVGNTTTQSSLTAGSKYYVQANGTIGTSASTPSVEAGLALSSTKLLIK